MHWTAPRCLAGCLHRGSNNAISIPMMVMTTSNSTSVNAVRTPRLGHIASSPGFPMVKRIIPSPASGDTNLFIRPYAAFLSSNNRAANATGNCFFSSTRRVKSPHAARRGSRLSRARCHDREPWRNAANWGALRPPRHSGAKKRAAAKTAAPMDIPPLVKINPSAPRRAPVGHAAQQGEDVGVIVLLRYAPRHQPCRNVLPRRARCPADAKWPLFISSVPPFGKPVLNSVAAPPIAQPSWL